MILQGFSFFGMLRAVFLAGLEPRGTRLEGKNRPHVPTWPEATTSQPSTGLGPVHEDSEVNFITRLTGSMLRPACCDCTTRASLQTIQLRMVQKDITIESRMPRREKRLLGASAGS